MPDLVDAVVADVPAELAADLVDAERERAGFGTKVRQGHDLEQSARFLLRAEAVASSRIEGLEVSTRRLARHAAVIRAGMPPLMPSSATSPPCNSP